MFSWHCWQIGACPCCCGVRGYGMTWPRLCQKPSETPTWNGNSLADDWSAKQAEAGPFRADARQGLRGSVRVRLPGQDVQIERGGIVDEHGDLALLDARVRGEGIAQRLDESALELLRAALVQQHLHDRESLGTGRRHVDAGGWRLDHTDGHALVADAKGCDDGAAGAGQQGPLV